MQITLCEDDGIFHDGTPTMVVLVVKFDDGKQKRIPYAAGRTISALYQDLNNIAPKLSESVQTWVDLVEQEDPKVDKMALSAKEMIKSLEPKRMMPATDKSNIIEKEDIVTLIRLDEGRNKEASCDLVVGHEYRVISVIATVVTLPGEDKTTRMVQGYDVVNDQGARPERTRVYPSEVTLKSKRISPIIKKELVISEIIPCPHCNVPNALALEGSAYKGVCTDCNLDIEISRIIKRCQTKDCANDVSCVDVGGKYQGKCTKCQANIEVPYA